MKAIILAAGVGSRIRPLTDNTPKSLLKIGEKTILERMVDSLLKVDIHDLVIVTGYLEQHIKDFTKATYPNLPIEFIRNDKYKTTNTGFSLMLTKKFVNNDDFIKFDADVVFEDLVLEKLMNDIHDTSLCIDRNIHLEAEEVKVIADRNGTVREVGKKLNPTEATGESIGIEKIGKKAGDALFEELESLMKSEKNHNQYYDDSYTTLAQKGIPFHAVDITGLKWVEVDTHEDFSKASNIFI